MNVLSDTDQILEIENDPDSDAEPAKSKSQTYFKNSNRHLLLEINDLQLKSSTTLNYLEGEIKDLPAPALRLVGDALLNCSSISIIGDPDRSTKVLPISFRSISEKKPDGSSYLSSDCVTLGFLKSDVEIGTGDEWFVDCRVPDSLFHVLVSSVYGGTVGSINIELILHNIYTSEKSAFSTRTKWFLRPNLKHPKSGPEFAQGGIVSFDMSFINAEQELMMQQASILQVPRQDPTPKKDADRLALLNDISKNIDKLCDTVRSASWLIVSVIFVGALIIQT